MQIWKLILLKTDYNANKIPLKLVIIAESAIIFNM